MEHKIRVGAVSYLNTKPLIYGFEQGMMKDELELLINYPSNIAALLQNDEIDIGLVPVAVISTLKEHHIISRYGIGCDGEVASVCLFSDVPVNEIKTVLLDYQSKTSVILLKILLKEYWKINPELIMAEAGYEAAIKGTTAGLVIGDRAFKQRQVSAYMYDLGSGWKEMTGLPFVFAAWVSNKKIDPGFVARFNEANLAGLNSLDSIAKANQNGFYDLQKYYTENVSYKLSPDHHAALEEFRQRTLLLNSVL